MLGQYQRHTLILTNVFKRWELLFDCSFKSNTYIYENVPIETTIYFLSTSLCSVFPGILLLMLFNRLTVIGGGLPKRCLRQKMKNFSSLKPIFCWLLLPLFPNFWDLFWDVSFFGDYFWVCCLALFVWCCFT